MMAPQAGRPYHASCLSEERPNLVLRWKAPSSWFELDPGVDDHTFCFQNVAELGTWEAGGGLEFFEHLAGDIDRGWVVALAVKSVPDVPAGVLAADDFELGKGCFAACFCFAGFKVFEADQGFVSGHWGFGLGRAGDDRGVDATGFAAEPVQV